jgi:hypothetical protein
MKGSLAEVGGARMMLPLFIKPLLIGLVSGIMVIALLQYAGAVDDGASWEVSTGYDYFQIGNGLPTVLQDQLDAGNEFMDLGLGYTGGSDNHQLSFGLVLKSDGDQSETDLKELVFSERVGKMLYEVGKTKWIWGRGLSFSPICPLDMDTYYWGGQSSRINIGQSLTVGAAWVKDSYNSDISDLPISEGIISGNDYTGWIRSGWVFETSDLTAVVSYQSAQNCWNYGCDFSRDLENGFELHGGVNLQSPAWASEYLLGGEYSGKYLYILEIYRQTDQFLILVCSNSAALLGHWQWELREVFNLTDGGEIRKINLKYIKNNQVIPELEISENAGAKNSEIRQNPLTGYVAFKLWLKF